MPRSTKRIRRESRKESVAAASSPSRPTKRRKSDPPSPNPIVEPLTQTEANDVTDDEDEDSGLAADQSGLTNDTSDEVSLITPFLLTPTDFIIQASKDHANSIHEANKEGVQAYAKIAARDWTFYVLNTTVNIGRSSDPAPSHTAVGRRPDDDMEASSSTPVHIDLGPGKVVSRQHSRVSFDPNAEKWMLQVIGRNGAKVDGVPFKAGATHTLSSGEVIDIGGVEMMFVLPSEISSLHIHPVYRQRCGLQRPAPATGSLLVPSSRSAQSPTALHQRKSSRSSLSRPSILPPSQESTRPGTPPLPSSRRGYFNDSSNSPLQLDPATSAASGLDLSHDDSQHVKPQFSYAQLITQAIMQTPDGKLNLNGIYKYIMDNYAYYRFQHVAGWQNSIRHNLSLNKAFDKVARSTDEPGKGMKWQIVPEVKDELIRNAFRVGRGGHRGSSAPSSPGQLSYISHNPKGMVIKDLGYTRKRKPSPALSPTPNTPSHSKPSFERQARKMESGAAASSSARDGSPPPLRTTLVPTSEAQLSPESPTLTTSYATEDPPSFITPAPPRVHLKLAPPSTAQRPSQHMPTSSPAPFWKYADIGSTPLKPSAHLDMSPPRNAPGTYANSSSPPPSRAVNRSPLTSPAKGQRQEAQDPLGDLKDPPDELGFDLTKGFQSIGSYHAPISRGAAVGRSL